MGDEQTTDHIEDAITEAKAEVERLKSDPDAVRKILGNFVTVTEKVTVYPDKSLNIEYDRIQDRIASAGARLKRVDGESDESYHARIKETQAEHEQLVSDFEKLKAAIEESAKTFVLESVSRKALKAIRTAARKKFPLPEQGQPDDYEVAEEREEWYWASIIAAHMVKDGYTPEDIEKIRDEWPTRCYAQLKLAAEKLSIKDDYLGSAFTPDFS